MWGPAYEAIDRDDGVWLEKFFSPRIVSCNSLQGLLDRAASLDKIASCMSLIDVIERKGCPIDINGAAREAAMHGNVGATLVLISRGATNHDELIDIADRSGYHGLAGFIRQKVM